MGKEDSKARPEAGRSHAAGSAPQHPGMPRSGGSILYLCEDLRVASAEVVPVLRRAGYRVKAVPIEEFRMRGWHRARWLLVLLDFAHLDGACFRLCARLRAVTRTPILAVLCGAASHDLLRVYYAGADGFIPGSVSQREFLVRMEALLRRRPLDGRMHQPRSAGGVPPFAS